MAARWIATIARTMLRVLVRLQPRAFRDRFGRDVLEDVRDEIDGALSSGARATLATSSLAIGDAARGVAAERLRELQRLTWRDLSMFKGLSTDLMMASRRVRSGPMLTLIVVATLGLAVGAATAIFSVADAVLLRPLPFPGSERLVRLDEETTARGVEGVSFPALGIWSREVAALESVAFYEPHASLVLINGEADRLAGATASRNLHDVIGVRPALGSGFSPGPVVGVPNEVVISHALWMRLGGQSGVLGTSLFVDPVSYTIVGIMPAGFAFPADADFWTTPRKEMERLLTSRDLRFLSAIGRLRPGATVKGLQSELDVLTTRYPATDRVGGSISMTGESLQDSIVGHLRRGITIVAGSAALLLLIAVCNVTALLLGRAAARRREIAVQSALGASSARLVRQSALEVLLLAVPGGMAGIAAAWACRDLIIAISFQEVPRIAEIAIDARALGFALAVTLTGAALATLLPATLSARAGARNGLDGASRDPRAAPGILRWLQGLVVGQVAITVVMLAGGLLLARTLASLAAVDTGFSATNVVTMRVSLPLRPPASQAVQQTFDEDVVRYVGHVPGVESVAFGSRLPLADALASVETRVVGEPLEVRAILQSAGPGFFATIGATIVDGREIADDDVRRGPAVVINELLARQLFGARSPVGRRMTLRYMTGPLDAEVVGVVRPLRYNGLAGTLAPEVYLDHRARTLPRVLFARVSSTPSSVIPALRAAVRRADATGRATVDQVSTLDDQIARHLARPRFFLALVGTFTVVALVLATTGLFGVMSFAVTQRRHEIGVRLALGASPSRLFRDVVGRGAVLTAIGLAVGVPAAAASVGFMRSLLFGVTPWDLLTFAAAAVIVSAIALAACWIPARRAQATDPLDVLRVS